MYFDRVIIGAGIYGLYAAQYSAKLGQTVLVLECEEAPFTRASYANQARLHMGYHYPRSFSTAIKTAQYFDRFVTDYKESINNEFGQIYATSANYSWTNKEQFIKFCNNAGIRCDNIDPEKYFNAEMCDGAYFTKEYAFDAQILRDEMMKGLTASVNTHLPSLQADNADMATRTPVQQANVQMYYNVRIQNITRHENEYIIQVHKAVPETVHRAAPATVNQATPATDELESSKPAASEHTALKFFSTKSIINATYASINQIQALAGLPAFQIKYELCELILCKVSNNLKNIGITVMDGPFFSIMPFGKTGYHTLSSVTFTPHMTSNNDLPTFDCQQNNDGYCTPENLGNCNTCPVKPKSAWQYMSALVNKYLKPEYKIEYVDSLYSIKPILKASEIDDSRPTLIKKFTENPTFISVLSGKINTIYDMDEVL